MRPCPFSTVSTRATSGAGAHSAEGGIRPEGQGDVGFQRRLVALDREEVVAAALGALDQQVTLERRDSVEDVHPTENGSQVLPRIGCSEGGVCPRQEPDRSGTLPSSRYLSHSRKSFLQLFNGHDGPFVPAVADDLITVGKGDLKHHAPIRRTHNRYPERDLGLNRRGADVEELNICPNTVLAGTRHREKEVAAGKLGILDHRGSGIDADLGTQKVDGAAIIDGDMTIKILTSFDHLVISYPCLWRQ